MNLNQFLNDLDQKGVDIWVDNDKLRYRAPKEIISSSLLDKIKQNKTEIIRILNNNSSETKFYPLSYSQQQIWINDQMLPGNPAYNVPFGYRIKGNLNINILENCFNKIIKRHEILRTTFTLNENKPVQVVHPELNIKLDIINLLRLDPNEQELHSQKLASEEATKSFNLSELPLLRIKIFKLSRSENIIIINLHHIVSDGWSLVLLMNELSALYSSFINRNGTQVPELSIQYGDYSLWDKNRLSNNAYQDQIYYWQDKLKDDLPVLDLPSDKKRPPVQTYVGANNFFVIDKYLCKELKSICQNEGCTFFMIILAAYQLLLSRYSNQDEIIVGVPFANRNNSKAEYLIGYFVNMTALRLNLSGNPTFIDMLHRVKEITLGAFSNQDVPFEKVVENLRFKRNPSRTPIFQATLEVSPQIQIQLSDLELERFRFDTMFSQFDLSLHMIEEDGYQARFEYNTDLFNEPTIKRISEHFLTLLKSIIGNPQKTIHELEYLTEEEKNILTIDWNDTNVDFPKKVCLHEIFEQRVLSAANKTALIFKDKKLSYRELNSKSNQLANYLISQNISSDEIVGIYLENSLETVIGILAALKLGCSYLPIDPMYPSERISFMVEDSGMNILFTQKKLVSNITSNNVRVVCLDSDWNSIEFANKENPAIPVSSNNPAYIIYTSGSTGRPKGTIIPHSAICNHMFWMLDEFGYSESDIFFQKTPISFDASVWEFYASLFCGGTLILSESGGYREAEYMVKTILKNNITVLQVVPTQLQLLLDVSSFKDCKSLRIVFCGGEELAPNLINSFYTALPDSTMFNLYGPSETTIDSTFWKCTLNQETTLIGRPISNARVYILDKNRNLVPIGVPGELYIGGEGVGIGYLNRAELTREKYIPNNFNGSKNDRLYKTGDLVRYRHDGNIEFLGRIDHQVKIRGFRIELGEIESIQNQYNGVEESVVIVREDLPGDKRIVSYLIVDNKASFSIENLRNYLTDNLPNHMVPSAIVFLDKFPLTPSGKIDRKSLPKPDMATMKSNEYTEPRDELDLQLISIWQKLLGVKNIGIKDNFFDLGGHSLLAAQLFIQIENKYGKKFPLSTLFQSPTIYQIADNIKHKDWKPSWNSLVPIKTKGSRPPLFLIHSAGGNVMLYRDLAKYFNNDQPIFGLQAKGLNGKKSAHTKIEDMASTYIEEIQEIYPDGPYLLGGYCMGGLIALEMAQQISKLGKEVPLVFFIETYNLGFVDINPIWGNLFIKFEKLYFHARNLIMLKAGDRRKFFKQKYNVFSTRDGLFKPIFNGKNETETNQSLIDLRSINDQAALEYKVTYYPGKIIDIIPHKDFSCYHRSELNWKCDQCKVVKFNTYPSGIIYDPFVKDLADLLNTEIQNTVNNID